MYCLLLFFLFFDLSRPLITEDITLTIFSRVVNCLDCWHFWNGMKNVKAHKKNTARLGKWHYVRVSSLRWAVWVPEAMNPLGFRLCNFIAHLHEALKVRKPNSQNAPALLNSLTRTCIVVQSHFSRSVSSFLYMFAVQLLVPSMVMTEMLLYLEEETVHSTQLNQFILKIFCFWNC